MPNDDEPAWGTSGPDNAPDWAKQQFASTTNPPYDDRAVWTMVHGAIARDPRIPANADIEVTVDGGTVTLTGSVPDSEQKAAVEEDTWATTGVDNVFNRLRVSHP
ncbi:MAG: BON domain-containing protein [Chloroflexota bacterium]|nr:BON domain-containing protein [Chloroflexota bacterium]